VQAYALTWAAPYRVECMSITTAFAFGFDRAFCAEGCRFTKVSQYFDSSVSLPFTQLKMRPTMSIAALSFEQARALIDRGVEADGTFPVGTAYLLSTSDKARDVRSKWYAAIEQTFNGRLRVRWLTTDALRDRDDVLFYFTGRAKVEGLDTLRFLPGAIADHLTSAGGALTDSGQMSVLRWLEAGATGSYGTVVEPCAFAQKFPHPAVLMAHYLGGETLIEAYWKSVDMPVKMLIDSVSKGGNLLLNVGPTGRGEFDERALDRLAGIGEWMKRHSRSIYGCTQAPGEFRCPEDCRYTYNPETKRLYLHVFSWPFRHLHIDGIGDRIEYAQLLNDASEVKLLQNVAEASYGAGVEMENRNTITLELPIKKPANAIVSVIEIFLK